ncbi:hypothetical protein FACS189440_02930 [Bacteroidia bacterium]|nr:hypothetical protein FACS189440_02930 [Bacteroidia bacterium]
MGRFTLNPEFGKQYYATCYQGEQSIQVNLPEVKNNTYALSSVWRQNKLWITVNKPAEQPCPEMYLVAHARGNIVYAGKWNSGNEVIGIEKEAFPSGVTHLLLLTQDFQPLSERLVFTIHVDDWLKPVIHTQKERYKPREQVKMDINVLHGIAGQARNDREENDDSPDNFAISITDDKDVKVDTTSTILSEILLTSELRGQIANPAYYFQPDNRQAEQAADLLMLTHGWNRYDIPAALRGDFRMPAIPAEQAQSLSGTVKGGLLSKPYKGARVNLFTTGLDFFDTRETDENGRFVFEDLEFADSVRYVVEASNKRGKDIVELYLDAVLFPPSTASWILPEASQMKDEEPEFLDYVAKADQKYVYENGMRMINLPELTVRGIDRRNEDPVFRSKSPKVVVMIDETGKAAVDFYSADGETNYTVIIEGISNNGIPIRNTKKIAVSSNITN